MKVWYDTEFIEDGRTIGLISIGMVAEDGREYYAVNSNAPWFPINQHTWLMANVIPHLPGEKVQPLGNWYPDYDHPDVKTHSTIADEVRDFLLLPNEPVELWAWYAAYDHVALAQLWGPMVSLPRGIPMWTNDLRQEVERLGNPRLPDQPAGLHHALDDARHLRDRHHWLQDVSEL